MVNWHPSNGLRRETLRATLGCFLLHSGMQACFHLTVMGTCYANLHTNRPPSVGVRFLLIGSWRRYDQKTKTNKKRATLPLTAPPDEL